MASRITEIESLEQWETFRDMLAERGYYIWQWQYGANHPEGFHIWLGASGRKNIEFMTRSKDIQKAMLRFGKK